VLHTQELIRHENGRAELGEELLNPQVESLLLDPEIKVVVNHDSGNGDAGLLTLDGFFVSLAVGKSGGLVKEEEVGAIGSATSGNQIIRHFLVKLGPLDTRLLDDTVDLGQRKSIIFTEGFGLGTTHLSKELFSTR